MFEKLSESARHSILLAEQEAKALGHEYIGTEHLLLGLLIGEPEMMAHALKRFDVSAAGVREEIDRLIQRGPAAVDAQKLSFTPRANRAIQIAEQESRILNQNEVGPEHLLVGLMAEPDGVAARVLRNLGLKPTEFSRYVLMIRLTQMKIVERAVRPVKASTARKRKMREELLAHFTAIYEEEQTRRHDSTRAIEAATERFGDWRELARELECAVPFAERIGYYIERWFGWRAPESAARYLLRQALQSFSIMAGICCVVAMAVLIGVGWHQETWQGFRNAGAMLLIVPLDQFLLGWFYFKLRDAMFGPYWASKSLLKVVFFDFLIAIVVLASAVGFIAISTLDKNRDFEMFPVCCVAAVIAAMAHLLLARFRGPTEIADTTWACLDIAETAT